MVVSLLVLAEVQSEAFFGILGGGRKQPTHRAPYSSNQARPPGRQVKSYGGGQKYSPPGGKPHGNNIPVAHGKPSYPKKPYPSKPSYPTKPSYPSKPHTNQRPYKSKPIYPAVSKQPTRNPGYDQKLDYSGWTPIGFDEKRPSAPVSSYVSDVVTLDDAIANAPLANTDDLISSAIYSEPAPEPIVISSISTSSSSSYSGPVSSSAPVLTTYVSPAPIVVPSSYGAPVPAVPYIPSTADIVPSSQYNSPAPQYSAPAPQYSAPAPQYSAPAPAPQYSASSSTRQFSAPASAPQYSAPAPQYSAPAPAPQYSAPAAATQYNSPAPAPQYNAPVAVSAPQYSAPAPAPQYNAPTPQYSAPAPAPQYSPPAPKPVSGLYSSPAVPPPYEAPKASNKISFSTYNTPSSEPTKAPVVIPAYTPSPSNSYDPSSFGEEQFPIISLITADNQPSEEQYVSFSIGADSGYNLPQEEPQPQYQEAPAPGQYQNTGVASNLAEEVSSGSVYVQNPSIDNDELYYIYYQDPDQDPSFGAKVQKERDASPEKLVNPIPSTLDASSIQSIAPADDIELFEDEEVESENQRDVRNQEAQEFFGNYKNIGGHSSVSVNFNVGGKASGFSYNL